MAASQIKALLDELARVLAEMGVLSSDEPAPADGSTPPAEGSSETLSDEQAARMDELAKRAEKIKAKIEFLERLAEKEKELRAVLDRAAPAPAPAPAQKASDDMSKPRAIYSSGKLRAFTGPNAEERAYRAGMWYKGFVFGDSEARRWCSDHGVESRALSEGSQGAAGNLVVDEVLNTVIKLVEDYGTFPAYARTIPMSSDVLIQPRRTGGVVAEFVGENTLIPDSDPAWDKVTLVAKKLVVSTRCSSEFLEDSIVNLADYITDEFARAFAQKIDECGWIGNGTGAFGDMTGVVTEIAKPGRAGSVYTSTAESFEELSIDDFTMLLAKLPLYAQRNAAWYISPAGFAASMQRLALSGGTAGLSGGNTARDIAGGLGLQFLGFPVRLVHVLDGTLGTDNGKIKVLFGDLSLSTMYGVRRQMAVRTSTERYAELDQTLMLATTRFAALTHDVGTATVAGPLVALKTAAGT